MRLNQKAPLVPGTGVERDILPSTPQSHHSFPSSDGRRGQGPLCTHQHHGEGQGFCLAPALPYQNRGLGGGPHSARMNLQTTAVFSLKAPPVPFSSKANILMATPWILQPLDPGATTGLIPLTQRGDSHPEIGKLRISLYRIVTSNSVFPVNI